MTTSWADLATARYISLETYRRDGTPVHTPLWFAAAGNTLVAYTLADSAKIKRLRRNPTCRVAACDMRGTVSGPWFSAHAEPIDGAALGDAMKLLNRKYWPWKQLLDLAAKFRSGRARVGVVMKQEGK